MEVMLAQYGCDDMDYLLSQSDKPNTIKVERVHVGVGPDGAQRYEMKTWYLPVARFDNRKDLTSFIRKDKSDWGEEEVRKLHQGLKEAFDQLV
jgi:hypothetical protein